MNASEQPCPDLDGDASSGPTIVYTDGACKGNPGPGGWGWVVPGGRRSNGGEPNTTNQRMELSAVLDALRELSGEVIVVSDSTYVVHCFRDDWWKGWIKRGWRNSKKEPVANRDIWEPLVELYRSRSEEIEFRWVKGHAGNEWNEIADQLAVEAAEAQPSKSGSVADAAAGAKISDVSVGSVWTPDGRSLAAFGAQPPALGGYDDNLISDGVRRRLAEIFVAKHELNPDLVILTGLRLGAETLAAQAAIDAEVPYVAILPFPDPDSKWPTKTRERFTEFRAGAHTVVVLERVVPTTPQQAGQSLSRRNAWMARVADEAVVVCDASDQWVDRLVSDLERAMPDEVWRLEI